MTPTPNLRRSKTTCGNQATRGNHATRGNSGTTNAGRTTQRDNASGTTRGEKKPVTVNPQRATRPPRTRETTRGTTAAGHHDNVSAFKPRTTRQRQRLHAEDYTTTSTPPRRGHHDNVSTNKAGERDLPGMGTAPGGISHGP